MELDKPPIDNLRLNQDKDYVIKKLGLTETEFEKIINSPNKNFNDYPNNDFLWRKFSSIIKLARKNNKSKLNEF